MIPGVAIVSGSPGVADFTTLGVGNKVVPIAHSGTLNSVGSPNVELTGASPVALAGSNTVNSVRSNGAANVSGSGTLTVASGGVILDSPSAARTFLPDLSLGAEGFIYVGANGGNAWTMAGVVSGASGFSKFGPGELRLGLSNTVLGPTTVNAGTLTIGPGSIDSASPLVIASAGTVDVQLGNNAAVAGLTGSGKIVNGLAGPQVNLNVVTGNLSDNFNFAGSLVAGNGPLKLTVGGAGTQTLSGSISPLVSLQVNSTATLALASGSTVTSPITFSGGTVALQGGTTLAGPLNMDQGTITADASATVNSIINCGGTVSLDSSGPSQQVLKVAGLIAAAGQVWKTGPGTVAIIGSNTYTGTTSVRGGKLLVGGGCGGEYQWAAGQCLFGDSDWRR